MQQESKPYKKVRRVHKKEGKSYSYSIQGKDIYAPLLYNIDFLQRTVGNMDVQRMFKTREILAKLYVNQPGDIYEQEADRIAELIVSMEDMEDMEDIEDIENQLKSAETKIQKKGSSGEESVTGQLEAKINAIKGRGESLGSKVRDYFQPRFGVDLGNVRIHTDSNADRLARAVRARAFTLGNDIVFAKGEYKPGTLEGKKLVAHELTHVIQQGNALSLKTQSLRTKKVPSIDSIMPESRVKDHLQKLNMNKNHNPGMYTREIEQFQKNNPVEKIQRAQQQILEYTPKPVISRTGDSKTIRRCGQRTPEVPKTPPDIPLTDEALGNKIVENVDIINDPARTATTGFWYSHWYRAKAQTYDELMDAGNEEEALQYKPYKDFWKEEYQSGYANPDYFQLNGFKDWTLKQRVSASEGIKDFINGFTIAECNTALQAAYLDAVRAAVGDDTFDDHFGSTKKDTPEPERLRIAPGGNSTYKTLCTSSNANSIGDKGTIGNRPNLKVGEWYYFKNHSKYLKKHPAGSFQGENAIYAGKESNVQLWSGFGISRVSELQMFNSMVNSYNAGRTPRDYYILLAKIPTADRTEEVNDALRDYNYPDCERLYNENIDKMPQEYKSGFPNTITRNDILNDPGCGFLLHAGIALDISKIEDLND
ncbi:MAG: DUF4157 domain-containing protein [Spirochaetales bacterium]|nr:DUF4157 domain-containing protein [Spirochaetales bacterium]